MQRCLGALLAWIAPLPPRWLLHLAWLASLVALVLTAVAGFTAVRADYPAHGPELDDVASICAAAQQPVEVRELRKAWPCACQAQHRRDHIAGARRDLRIACARHGKFSEDLQYERPEARTWIQQEATEIVRANGELRALLGSAVYPGQLSLLAELALNLGFAMATMVALGKHAHWVGIPPVDEARKIGVPLAVVTAITFGVSAAVTAWESLDPHKGDFDGNSYCMVASSFWLGHASVPLLSLVVGAQLATGWYATRSEHVPAIDATKVRWGVGTYVFFLEVWSFAAIVISAGTAAFWIHALAGSPLASARTEGMLGFGALGVVLLLLGRLVRNGYALRAHCEAYRHDHPKKENLPADPTASFIGETWKLPAAFAAAFGIAYKLLELAGVGRLVNPSP
jgi:hypothetical protein